MPGIQRDSFLPLPVLPGKPFPPLGENYARLSHSSDHDYVCALHKHPGKFKCSVYSPPRISSLTILFLQVALKNLTVLFLCLFTFRSCLLYDFCSYSSDILICFSDFNEAWFGIGYMVFLCFMHFINFVKRLLTSFFCLSQTFYSLFVIVYLVFLFLILVAYIVFLLVLRVFVLQLVLVFGTYCCN